MRRKENTLDVVQSIKRLCERASVEEWPGGDEKRRMSVQSFFVPR